MGWQVYERIWDHASSNIVQSDRLMLLAMAKFADDYGVCWPGHSELARMVGVNERSASRIIDKLERSGQLYVLPQGGQRGGRGYTDVYLITTGLTSEEIAGIIASHPRFKPVSGQATEIAAGLIERQAAVREVAEKRSFPRKGVTDNTHNNEESGKKRVLPVTEKGVTGDQKGVTGDQKGVIHNTRISIEPSYEPSLEPLFAAVAENREGQEVKRAKAKTEKQLTCQAMFTALAALCQYDLDLITDKQRGALNQAGKKMREKDYTPADIEAFGVWWYANDWRGKQGQPPTLGQIRETWGQFKNGQKGATSANGNSQKVLRSTLSEDDIRRQDEFLSSIDVTRGGKPRL